MEKSLAQLRRSMLFLLCHQLFSAIVIFLLAILFVRERAPKLTLDASFMPLFMAGLGAALFLYLAIFLVFLLKIFEETSQIIKHKDSAEPWMATIGPGAFFFPRQLLIWKEDAAGNRVQGSEQMLYCLPANSVAMSSLSVPLSKVNPQAVSISANFSGKQRLIYSEDNIYMVVFALPSSVAKSMLSSSQQKLLPPK